MDVVPLRQTGQILTRRRQALTFLVMGFALATLAASIGDRTKPTVVHPRLQIDPNTAPVGVLEALPRIGPTIASRIIEARESALFRDEADLDRRVRGLGPVTMSGIRPHLRFESTPDR